MPKHICVDRIQVQGIMGEWRAHISKKKKIIEQISVFLIDDGIVAVLLL